MIGQDRPIWARDMQKKYRKGVDHLRKARKLLDEAGCGAKLYHRSCRFPGSCWLKLFIDFDGLLYLIEFINAQELKMQEEEGEER